MFLTVYLCVLMWFTFLSAQDLFHKNEDDVESGDSHKLATMILGAVLQYLCTVEGSFDQQRIIQT